jgi:ferrous iron transport protein B
LFQRWLRYTEEEKKKKNEKRSLSLKDDLKDLILTFAEKTKEAGLNLISSFRVVSISAEVPEEGARILSKLQKKFTLASALSFLVHQFVRLIF